MSDVSSRLRREKDILERIENVKRLIQMETTLLVSNGASMWCRYCMTDREGKRLGGVSDDLLRSVREEIQLQLLSIAALCYGDNPDVGEPIPMLEWKEGMCDEFRDTWEKCLMWNA